MKVVNEAIKFSKDIIRGAWDTIIVAPFSFGKFLGNISGLAGKQQQFKAKTEFLIAKEAISAVFHNTAGARDFIIKEIGNDVKKDQGIILVL